VNILLGLERLLVPVLDRISSGTFIKGISSEEVSEWAETLYKKLAKERFDVVVGIERGGLPLAKYLAERLDLEMDSMKICIDGDSKFKDIMFLQGVETGRKTRMIKPTRERYENMKILVVDEDCYTGKTLRIAEKYLKGDVKTAVLVDMSHKEYKPDFYAVKPNTKMKVLPWHSASPRYIDPMEYKIKVPS